MFLYSDDPSFNFSNEDLKHLNHLFDKMQLMNDQPQDPERSDSPPSSEPSGHVSDTEQPGQLMRPGKSGKFAKEYLIFMYFFVTEFVLSVQFSANLLVNGSADTKSSTDSKIKSIHFADAELNISSSRNALMLDPSSTSGTGSHTFNTSLPDAMATTTMRMEPYNNAKLPDIDYNNLAQSIETTTKENLQKSKILSTPSVASRVNPKNATSKPFNVSSASHYPTSAPTTTGPLIKGLVRSNKTRPIQIAIATTTVEPNQNTLLPDIARYSGNLQKSIKPSSEENMVQPNVIKKWRNSQHTAIKSVYPTSDSHYPTRGLTKSVPFIHEMLNDTSPTYQKKNATPISATWSEESYPWYSTAVANKGSSNASSYDPHVEEVQDAVYDMYDYGYGYDYNYDMMTNSELQRRNYSFANISLVWFLQEKGVQARLITSLIADNFDCLSSWTRNENDVKNDERFVLSRRGNERFLDITHMSSEFFANYSCFCVNDRAINSTIELKFPDFWDEVSTVHHNQLELVKLHNGSLRISENTVLGKLKEHNLPENAANLVKAVKNEPSLPEQPAILDLVEQQEHEKVFNPTESNSALIAELVAQEDNITLTPGATPFKSNNYSVAQTITEDNSAALPLEDSEKKELLTRNYDKTIEYAASVTKQPTDKNIIIEDPFLEGINGSPTSLISFKVIIHSILILFLL